MTRRAIAVAAACTVALAGLASAGVAQAQYSFSVPEATLQCDVNADASVTLRYRFVFQNAPYGQPIDVVDVGMPHDDYDIHTMHATLDGNPIGAIGPSTYIDTGVEVRLGVYAIPAGQRGVFEFDATVPDLVFSDTTDEGLASFEITPTWFDPSVLIGTTDLRIAIHIPGVQPEAVLHHGTPFDRKAVVGDGALVGFVFMGTRLNHSHDVGISFPRTAMTRVVEITRLDLLERAWEASFGTRVIFFLLLVVVFGIVFFRFTGRTGISVFLVLVVIAGALFYFAPVVQLYAQLPMLLACGGMEWLAARRKRAYLPPIASVEGGGIKRGLTAPEAAVLLQLPIGRVLTLVLFGLLKKRLAQQVAESPLRLVASPDVATGDRAAQRKAAAKSGTVIHGYEHAFLEALRANAGFDVTETDFGPALRELVEHTADRVLGFDVDETKKYYRQIVERAWREAEALGEISARTDSVDKNLEWLLLDDSYGRRLERWESSGWHYRPIWLRPMPVVVGPGPSLGSVLTTPGHVPATGASAPGFGDVAASFAGFTEKITGQISSAILPGAAQAGGRSGVMDLSGFDKATGQALSAFFSGSGRGGGGGGGGCACACAGCACACACAGGGR